MVQLKKKVTLRTKVSEDTSPSFNAGTPKTNSGGNGKKWIIAIAVAGLIAGGYFWLKPSKREADYSIVTEQHTINPAANDSVSIVPASIDTDTRDTADTGDITGSDIQKKASPQGLEETGKEKTASKSRLDNSNPKANLKQDAESITASQPQHTLSQIETGTLKEKAIRVIRGDFGNGEERKTKLGSEYQEIQNKVNEMYRNGLVK